MTRLEQALRWWRNNKSIRFRTIEARRIPVRHLDVLLKAHKLELTWDGEDIYRLRTTGDPNV